MIVTAILSVCIFLLAFTGTAYASEPLLDAAKPVFNAVMDGHWAYAAALALVFLVALARRYGTKLSAWFASGEAGAAMALFGSFGGALATALAGGAKVTGALAWTAFTVALAAAGGFSLVRAFLPRIRKVIAKLPTWAQRPLELLLWVFDKPALAAEAAGNAAVAAKPAKGIVGFTGKPTELK